MIDDPNYAECSFCVEPATGETTLGEPVCDEHALLCEHCGKRPWTMLTLAPSKLCASCAEEQYQLMFEQLGFDNDKTECEMRAKHA